MGRLSSIVNSLRLGGDRPRKSRLCFQNGS